MSSILRFLFATLLFMGSVTIHAKSPVLKFNTEGKFKILQITDVHYIHKNESSIEALERISDMIDVEKPDLILLTGDIIWGKPAKEGMEEVMKTITSKNIPFGLMYGNHDDEFELSRQELYELTKPIKNNLTSTVEGLTGVTNYTIEIKGSKDKNTAAVLYCMDSNAYSKLPGIGGYDYIYPDQVEWYRNTSKHYTTKNNNKPLPALAFFHIPTPEYETAGLLKKDQMKGNFKEGVCSPKLNSGLFLAMREQGDVKGIFVGHDHDNDFTVDWYGILLAYGRYSGGDTVYNNLGDNGVRLIEMSEGSNEFKTWIRTSKGIEQNHTYPTDYIKKE